MSYRPDDWNNPHPDRNSIFWAGDYEVYELGADAILEYLSSQKHQDWLATPEGESCSGKWVFIPDDD